MGGRPVAGALNATALSVEIKTRLGAFTLDVAFRDVAAITVLFGPSGAGKSATIAAIAGALRPDSGRIALGDQVFYDKRARIDLRPEHRRVGWVFQEARLFPHLNVRENLEYGLHRAKAAAPGIGFEEVVGVLGLERLLTRRPLTLSGGEAQRTAIGRALLSQPRLLLMDEPLASLDDFRKEEILTFIERVREVFGVPIVYVTHSRAEALRLAEQVVVMDEGRVILVAPPEQAVAAAMVRFAPPPAPSPSGPAISR